MMLNEMIADGTFNAMFLADNQVQTVLSKANLSSRRVIELDNPTLSSTHLIKIALCGLTHFNERTMKSLK